MLLQSQLQSKLGWIALGIVVIVVAGFYWLMKGGAAVQPAVTSSPTATMVPTATMPVSTATPQPTMVGWKTATDSKTGVTFQYPPSLGTTYITPVDWPPTVKVLNQAFSCVPGGSPIGQGGQTMKVTINGHLYCLTQASEGAAGSTYTTYTYTFASGAKTISISLVLRMVQCANYDQPQQKACKQEQAHFDIGTIVDGIAQTVKL